MTHEGALVKAFILSVRQERYLEFLKTPKNRKKIIAGLAHFKHLKRRLAFEIPGNQSNPDGVLELLTRKGAGSTCWVISENDELDGREIDLSTALKETIGCQMGTFLSCVPGKLAYFEDEDARDLLER